MAGQMMHRDAGGDLFVAGVEDNPVAMGQTHHVQHVIQLERMAQ